MKTSTPVWKPLLLAFVLLMLFVSTGALFNAAAYEGSVYYVFGALNLAVYAVGLWFLYRYLFTTKSGFKMTDSVAEGLYTLLGRYHQARKLPNKTFKTKLEQDGVLMEINADKENDIVDLKITE